MNQMIENVFIHDCPHCGNSHVHRVIIDFANVGGGPFFAGKNDKQDGTELVTPKVSLKCPTSGLLVQKTIKIQIPKDSVVKSIKEISNEKIPPKEKEPPNETSINGYSNPKAITSEKEYHEWSLQSFTTIRSFAERMVTLNVGSIGLMVSLLTFLFTQGSLRFEAGEIFLLISCLSLFILSIVFFVMILFPIFMQPATMREFIRQKERAAKRLWILSLIAVASYILALILSLVLLFLAIL